MIQTEATKHKVGKMRCKCQQTAGHPPAPLNSSVTKQTSKTNMAFALWEPHYATCPSGSSQGVYIVSEPLLPCYVFIKKRSGSPIQKTWAVSLQLCPLTVWPWQKQSHLATRAKWKKKRCAGKPSDASLRENTAKEGEEEGEEWGVKNTYKLQNVWYLREREQMLDRKLFVSSGHDEFDASFSTLLQKPQRHFC